MKKWWILALTLVVMGMPTMADLARAHSNLNDLPVPDIFDAVRRGGKIYATAGDHGIHVIDVKLGGIIDTISLSGTASHIVTAGNNLYVVASSEKKHAGEMAIYIFDATTLQEISQIPLSGSIRGLTIVENDLLAVVYDRQYVEYFRPSTKASVGKVEGLVGLVYGRMDFDHKGTVVYVPEAYPGLLHTISSPQQKFTQSLPVEDWIHAVKVFGRKAFVAGHLSGIIMVDLDTKEQQKLYDFKNASLFSDDRRLFAIISPLSQNDTSAILELDTATGAILHRTKIAVEKTAYSRTRLVAVERDCALFMVPGKKLSLVRLSTQ